MELVVVRHGETKANVEKICSSKVIDSPCLTKKGKEQAKKVRDKLKNENFKIIFTSRLLRAQETANYINQYHSKNIVVDRRLDDVNTGFEDLPVKNYHDYLDNSKDTWNTKYGGGESFEEMKIRIFDFLDELKKQNYERVLIVSHMETIQIFNIYFYNFSNKKAFNFVIDNCEFQTFSF